MRPPFLCTWGRPIYDTSPPSLTQRNVLRILRSSWQSVCPMTGYFMQFFAGSVFLYAVFLGFDLF